MPKRFSGQRIGQVDRHNREVDRGDGIPEGHARVGQPTGVEQRPANAALGLMEVIDQGPLVVALEELERHPERFRLDLLAEGVELVINDIPIAGRCRSCSNAFEYREMALGCPDCGSRDVKIESGLELNIRELEIDDAGS